MMLTLFESQARRAWISQGALISLSVHALMISAAVAATRPAAPGEEQDVSETVRFLVPMDHILSQKPQKVNTPRLEFTVAGKGGGNEGTIVRKIERKAPVPDDAAGKGTDEGALQEPAPPPPVVADTVMTVLEVDSAVTRFPDSAAPAYPPKLLAQNIQGQVAAQFVVDTLGLVDTTSFRVLDSTHPEFIEAVRSALPGMRFHPAIAHSTKVRQLVQQAFSFKITPPPTDAVTAKGPGEKGKKP